MPTTTRRDDDPNNPNPTETRRDWEIVQENVGESKTDRLRIAGGWLVRTTMTSSGAVALVFVPGAV